MSRALSLTSAALTVALLAAQPACTPSRPSPPGLSLAWSTTVARDHPLAGRIWDPRASRFVGAAALEAGVAGGRFVLLGETHDNPDHHALQARLIRAMTAAGRRPALALEMLSTDQQPAIDAALAGPAPRAEALREAVAWDRSGWPPFEEYRTVIEAALAADLPVVGANLPRQVMSEVVRRGAAALPTPVLARLEAAGPLSDAERRERREEMAESHCGELPESILDPLLLAQRARDAQLAEALLSSGRGEGAVLVTGAEHARRDRGVTSFLGTSAGVVTVAFLEVAPDAPRPSSYGPLPYDFVVFTPGAARGDPCEGLRRHHGRSRR